MTHGHIDARSNTEPTGAPLSFDCTRVDSFRNASGFVECAVRVNSGGVRAVSGEERKQSSMHEEESEGEEDSEATVSVEDFATSAECYDDAAREDYLDAAWDMFSGHSILDPTSPSGGDSEPDPASQDPSPTSRSFAGQTASHRATSPSRGLTGKGSCHPAWIVRADEGGGYPCPKCKKLYKTRKTLQVHSRFQCGKEPQFACPLCPKKAYQKVHIEMHVWGTHKMIGWKYWNKDRPADENNRPHAMPEKGKEEVEEAR
ncbi:zinc finger protein 526-like [Diaphorina citri]|nr:zinc finger protein 526-like [Diaphorina citri]